MEKKFKWCVLEGSAQNMGGSQGTLAQGDPDAFPSKVQLAIIDADYGASNPVANWDKDPWSEKDFLGAVEVCCWSGQFCSRREWYAS